MKRWKKLCVAAIYAVSICSAAAAEDPVDFMSVNDLKYAIQLAIRDSVRDNDREPYYLITNINLELKGTEDTGVGGGFKIPVFGASASLDGTLEHSATHTLELKLVPAESLPTRAPPNIKLSELVSLVKEAFQLPNEATGQGEDLPALTAPTFNYSYSGSLKQSAEGGVDFVVFDISGAAESATYQTISFQLCRTLNRQNCIEQ